jgi:hypothetical protein
MAKPISPLDFIDRAVRKNELGQPWRLMDHQREILRLAFAFDSDGRLAWDTVIYSCVKKSGKTTLNGALTLWWAFTQEAPNEILIVANDLEQSLARVFRTMEGIIEHNPELRREAEVQTKTIFLDNATTIKAISSDYQGASGSNHGWVSFDELWAYTSENSRRLFEELTSVPTRRNSIRFITTYSGFEGESQLLMDLYKKSVGRDEHLEGQGERIHPELPIYVNREARIFAYWDHIPRMPWQTPEYYDAQRRTLRPNTYLRLHENRWSSAEEVFITSEQYDSCVEPGLRQNLRGTLFIGADLATKRDCCACVVVRYDDHSDRLQLADYKIWKPLPGQPINLEASIEFYLRRIFKVPGAYIQKILIDPYQAARTIQTLTAAGLPVEEYNQTQGNLTESTEALYSMLTTQGIRLYNAPDLRDHVLGAAITETPRGIRLSKQKQTRKIDGAVALSFAVLAAVQAGKPLGDDDGGNYKPTEADSNFDPRLPDTWH